MVPLTSHLRPTPPCPVPGRRLRWALAVVAIAALVAGCSDSSDGATAGGAGTSPAATADGGTGGTGSGPAAPSDPSVAPDWTTRPLVLAEVAQLAQPIALATRPATDEAWLAERAGRVRRLTLLGDPSAGTEEFRLDPEPVLDLTDRVGTEGEGGLLGLAFAPDGSELYLDYTDRDGDTVVAAHPIEGDGADPDGRVVLTVDQPYSNHNGGALQTGPDGLLYVALGDGGAADDPDGNGQDTTTLLGSVLRLDPTPDGDAGYTVPADNPFVDDPAAAPEIWLYGVRNPWRMAFDPETGDLWLGDVGQNEVEEVDLLPAADGAGRGANLGWNRMEGDQPFAGEAPADHVGPVHQYLHGDGGCSITGGEVYRGGLVAELAGAYLYSDYCAGGVVGVRPAAGAAPTVAPLPLADPPTQIISFGRGPDGEVYVLEQGGRVSRIQAADAARPASSSG